jgi:hypothetical protein
VSDERSKENCFDEMRMKVEEKKEMVGTLSC